MTSANPTEPDLEDLAATAVRLGRELEQMAHAVYLGGNSRDFGIVSRALRRLADRKPFDSREASEFAAIAAILDGDLQSEVVGTEQRFLETHCDEEGVQGEVVACPIYSERGIALLKVKQTFEAFVAARDATLDRVAADRALRRLLSA